MERSNAYKGEYRVPLDLDNEDRRKLDYLRKMTGATQSNLLRRMIRDEYEAVVEIESKAAFRERGEVK